MLDEAFFLDIYLNFINSAHKYLKNDSFCTKCQIKSTKLGNAMNVDVLDFKLRIFGFVN